MEDHKAPQDIFNIYTRILYIYIYIYMLPAQVVLPAYISVRFINKYY